MAPVEGFATSAACQECHPGQYASWHASFHRTMTRVATPETVVGDFGDVRLSTTGCDCTLMREGTRFLADVSPAEQGGAPARREIVLCTGSHHMQVYWYPTGESRTLAQLPFVFLRESQRWVPRNAAFLRPPERAATDERGRWNQTCIKCHTTGARPGIDEAGAADAHVAEFGISCEACHGPAAEHVAAHRADRGKGGAPDQGDVVSPARVSHEKSAEVCGQCHSVSEFASDDARKEWQAHGFHFRPGGDLSEERSIVRAKRSDLAGRNVEFLKIVASAFWPDGMVRIAGREYNGLIESPCFQRGEISCLSCHSLHKDDDDPRPLDEWADGQVEAGMRTNAACTQCHEQFAKSDGVSAHTHHAADSTGSLCMNCHMPYTSYGLLKATRSHQISSPGVAATLMSGRPNACNQCHLNRTLEWTAQQLSRWYGAPQPPIPAEQRVYAASVLWALKGDAGQRALAAWNLGWAPAQQASGAQWLAPLLGQLMNDPYDAVRYMAGRSLRTIEGYRDFDYDFLVPPAEREKRISRLMERWEKGVREQPAPRIGKALLLNADGSLRREEFELLLRARDERPVMLVE